MARVRARITPSTLLTSSQRVSYRIDSLLGEGAFGKVWKCTRQDTGDRLAIKLMDQEKDWQMEITFLKLLDPNEATLVRFYETFEADGHTCVVMELLGPDLQAVMEARALQPLSIPQLRPILCQVLRALCKLKELRIIHTDIKPENIALVAPTLSFPYRVKVIDFNCARHEPLERELSPSTNIQTRFYRAPEVMLGLQHSTAMDMWSLGCVMAELYHGWPLFPGSHDYDMMRYVRDLLEQPPEDLLDIAPRTNYFFHRTVQHCWQLKSTDSFTRETGLATKENRFYQARSLGGFVQQEGPSVVPDQGDQCTVRLELYRDKWYKSRLAELLNKMLAVDPRQRVTPSAALEHLLCSTNTVIDVTFCFEVDIPPVPV